MKGQRRLTLDLSPAAWARLDRLRESTEYGTKVGVIQGALQLLEFVVDSAKAGHVLLDRAPDGNVERVHVLGTGPGRESDRVR